MWAWLFLQYSNSDSSAEFQEKVKVLSTTTGFKNYIPAGRTFQTLGEESFDVFYPGGGFMALHNIINNKPELIEKIVIKDEQARNYSVTKFLDKLEKWRIKT